jgi:hypothetical protein
MVRERGSAHVRARTLDPHHPLGAPQMICNLALTRGIAAPVDHEGLIIADAPGAFDEFREGVGIASRTWAPRIRRRRWLNGL